MTVARIEPATPSAYFKPGADPGEGYMATNDQLYGSHSAPASESQPPMCRGFVKDFAYTLNWQAKEGRSILPGTVAGDIMGCFTPEALPVLSGLAKGYAVCDHWFASAPTETMPNRAFACAATSQGHMDDKTHTFTAPSIFGLLGGHGLAWAIYGYDAEPLTRSTFTDIAQAAGGHIGRFTDFTGAAAAGLTAPRTDDPLAGVTVPASAGPGPAAGHPSHLQEIQAELISRRFPAGVEHPPGVTVAASATVASYENYVRAHSMI